MSQLDKIRVLFLFASFGYGGTDVRIWRLAGALDESRFETYLNCYKNEVDPRYDLRPLHYCDIRYARLRSWGFMRALRQYARLLRELSIDVVQASFYEESVVAAMLQHITGVAAVYQKVNERPPPRGTVNQLALRYRNRHLDYVTANCNALKPWLEQHEGLPAESTRVIPNGVDTRCYHPATAAEKQEARAALGLPADHFVVVAVANLSPQKRLDQMVAAASQVVARSARTSFVVVGEGPCRADLEAQIQRLELGRSVHLVGSLADVRPALWAADVGVLTSETEGSPNAVLEYMATGLPVAATDVGGVSDMVDEGRTGFVVPRGDVRMGAERILQLAADAPRRAAMGEGARARAEQSFSFEQMVDRYACLYTEAAATARARRARP